MSCKICGRNNCTESFHSLEEQNRHEDPEKYYESIIQALEAENEKLRGYPIQHKPDCLGLAPVYRYCTCGLKKLLAPPESDG